MPRNNPWLANTLPKSIKVAYRSIPAVLLLGERGRRRPLPCNGNQQDRGSLTLRALRPHHSWQIPVTDDHARQERILKRASNAYQVRELLTEEKLTTQHKLFKFIGIDAYRDAGGTITGDLFAHEGEGYADDPELVERLADEKLDGLADAARAEGWGDVVVGLETPYNSYSWHRLYGDEATRSVTQAEQARMMARTGWQSWRHARQRRSPN